MHTQSNLATRTELETLHRDFTRDLLRQLKRGASAAMLSVVRAFLRDNHMLGLAHDERDRKRLERMYGMYVRHLLDALESPDKLSSAMLGEIRAFLASQDVGKSLQVGVTRAQALAALADASLPFTAPH